MKRFSLAAIAVVAVFGMANNAKAIFVIDTFSEPPALTHASTPAGTPFAGPFAPPQTIVLRTLTGRAPLTTGPFDPGALRAGSGVLTGALAPGEMAMITWTLAAPMDFAVNNVLGLMSFAKVFPTAMGDSAVLDVFVDGAPVGSALWSGPEIKALHLTGAPAAGTVVDVIITASAGNVGAFAFSGASVVANPEPATMALIGLGVLGGAIGYRRRRKEDPVTETVA